MPDAHRYNSLEEWLNRFAAPLQEEVGKTVQICKDYFTERKEFFRQCGFYVVGSSLTQDTFDDIDLVLVGLDFRQVFKYSKGFLSADDLPEVVKQMKEPDCELAHYCTFQIQGRPELYELGRKIEEHLPYSFREDSRDTPFSSGAYVHDSLGEWLVSRLELYKGKDHWEDYSKRPKPTIDLMFHAENMLVSSWKRLQEQEGLPYLSVIELYTPEEDTIQRRPHFDMPLPDFVDAQGKESMKRHWWKEEHRKW